MAVEGLSIGLYLDHNAHRWLGRDLRPLGYSVTVAAEVGNRRASDEAHLQWATEHGLVVSRSMSEISGSSLDGGLSKAETTLGSSCRRRRRVSPMAISLRRLRAFLDAVSADEMCNQVRWLDASWDRAE